MARILGTSIGKTSSIIFLILVVFIALALSNVSFLVSHTTGVDNQEMFGTVKFVKCSYNQKKYCKSKKKICDEDMGCVDP